MKTYKVYIRVEQMVTNIFVSVDNEFQIEAAVKTRYPDAAIMNYAFVGQSEVA